MVLEYSDMLSIAQTVKQGDHILVTNKWVQDMGYPKPDHPQ